MLYLRTFRRLALDLPGEPVDTSAHRRRLALLAVVAAAEPAGISRDRVVALLWPDRDLDKARHSLAQLSYGIRKDWQAVPIVGAAELRLDPTVIAADIVAFREAAATADHDTVARLYQGEFLDGFVLAEAPEFERWQDEERRRLHRMAKRSFEALAARADGQNDARASVDAWRRVAELDPLDAMAGMGYMEALAAAGDRGEAVAHADRYAALVRTELDAEPEAGFRDLADRLRREMGAAAERIGNPAAGRTLAASGPASLATTASGLVAAADPSALAGPDQSGAVAERLTQGARARGRLLWFAAAMVLVAVTAAAVWNRRPLAAAPGDVIIVADVVDTAGDSTVTRALEAGLAAALRLSAGTRPLGAAEIRGGLIRMGLPAGAALTDSIARDLAVRVGARYVLETSLSREGEQLLVTTRLVSPRNGDVLRVHQTRTERGDLVNAADGLARKLRRSLGDSRAVVEDAPPLPQVTTGSLEALELYGRGVAAFNVFNYSVGRELLTAAIARDSLFTGAHVLLGALEYVNNNPTAGEPHFERALALLDRLPAPERLRVRATVSRWHGDWTQAAALHAAYLQLVPYDAEGWQLLGYDYLRGKDAARGVAAYERAAELRPLDTSDWWNLATLYSMLRRFPASRRAYGEAIARDSGIVFQTIQNHEFGRIFVALGQPDSARQVFSLLLAGSVSAQGRAERSLGYLDLWEGRVAQGVDHLRRAATLSAAALEPLSEARSRTLLAGVLFESGETDAARRELALAVRHCLARPLEPPLLLWAGKIAARQGDLASATRLLDSLTARMRPESPQHRAARDLLRAEVLLAKGAVNQALPLAEQAMAADPGPYPLESVAAIQRRAGDWAAAAQSYRQLGLDPERRFGVEGQQYVRMAPFWLADVEERRGGSAEALRGYRQFLDQWPNADPALPFIRQARERVRQLSAP